MAEEHMTYSADFRAQVIKSVKNKEMSIRQACAFYHVSKTAFTALAQRLKYQTNSR